jgi:hypothetical protein
MRPIGALISRDCGRVMERFAGLSISAETDIGKDGVNETAAGAPA